MNPVYEKLLRCYDSVKARIDFTPEIAIVLGSGLGDYADRVEQVAVLDYKDIEGFPVSTALGHKGRFVFGYIEEVPVVVMQGRVHYYEGYDITDVVLPIRLMGLLGAKVVFLTNASGGIADGMQVGDLMLINGHISSLVPSPLIGQNIDELGVRFPDMSDVYAAELRDIIKKTAAEHEIPLQEGVYIQTTGPNYETPQEIQMYKLLGADAVGMSTAVEAMVANHMGMRVCGISCISNLAAGISKTPLTHEEIQVAADLAAPRFRTLVRASVIAIHKSLQ